MAHLDALSKRRSNLKGSLTKICNYANAQKEIEASQLDIELLKVRLRRVETLLIEFHEVEQAISVLKKDDESQQDDFEEKYYTAVADLNKLIRKANLAGGNMSLELNDTQGDSPRSANIEVKLPKINIAPFYGSYTEWQSFYDLFSSTIHENPNLNPAQKFQYLKGFLRNEAANLLKHLPISDANYLEALNKLKTRYDRKRYTVQSFIKNLVDIPSINNPTSQHIRKIMDTADEVIRGLKAIGPEAETRDPWLVYLLIQKLDEETRDKWANETASIEFPTCQSLIDFLMRRADALDSVKGYPRKAGSVQTKANTRTFAAAVASCSVCKSDYHPLFKCPKFKEWSVEERRRLMKIENRCFNCFSQSHGAYNCISKGRCHYCKRNHNSLLHLANNTLCSPNEDQIKSDQPASTSKINPAPASNSQQCLHSIHQSYSAILPTATVKVQERNGQYKLCRVLLDSGSQTSMITEAFVQKLGLERKNGRVCIQGLANQKLVTTRGIVTLTISPHMQSSFTCEVSAYIVPSITKVNPIHSVEWLKCKCLTSLSLADLGLKSASKIDLLIGADKFFDILKPEQLRDSNSQIYAHNTHFGWVLTGNTPHVEESSHCHTSIIDDNRLDKSLKRFWESEEVFSTPALLPEHQICEDLFQSTTKKLLDSHYMVRLPFKPERSPLKASIGIAIKRLHSMEKKFRTNPKLQERYIEFMDEYKSLKHMVEVEPPEYPLDYLYLPHHGVWKETSTTTKLRVVFDASAKTSSGHSLNDNLLTGPTLQNLLSDILIRFRIYKVVITADAEKMFRQIWIHPSDLRYQRIVWRRSPDLNIKHYELRTLTYGMSSAPYLATRSEITKKIIFKYHKTYLHCGASLLMSLLRRKYWIIRARDLIKSTIRKCVYCIKQKPKTENQIMGSLPRERVELIRPFLKVGLDFAGPIKTYLRRGRGQRFQKSYICLIVCLSTKAVHLEIVGDLTTQSFLGALNRFFARRGVSTDIFSDNGSNFRGASTKFKEINLFIKNNLEFISHSMLRTYQITWHFIPPHAPHFGGIWEAGVKSAKTHMERVIGDQILTQEELYTLLVQIEGLLNSRPLCALSDDEFDPLTPAHFLIGHPITTIPQADITEVPFNRLDHWSAVQKMTQLFWNRWHQEYLTSIQARTKWSQTKDNLQVNDVVLVKEENPLVNQWRIGKIIQVFPGSDERVRVVEIKTNQGNIRRPITKVCRLPVN